MKKYISDSDCIRAWLGARTYKQVSDKSGFSYEYIRERISKLRRAGYDLSPLMVRGKQTCLVSDRKFILIWNSSKSRAEIAKKLKCSYTYVDSKARYIRKEYGHSALKKLNVYHFEKQKKITDKNFIRIWNSSYSMEEVVKRTRLKSSDSAHHVAWRIRKLGVLLKQIRPLSSSRIDTSRFGEYKEKYSEFITLWESGVRPAALCKILKMTPNQVRGLAHRLRIAGISLEYRAGKIKRLSDDECARIWRSSKNREEAVKSSGYSYRVIHARVQNLILKGRDLSRSLPFKRDKRARKIPISKFINLFYSSKSLSDLAKKTGYTPHSASMVAHDLRKEGFALPRIGKACAS